VALLNVALEKDKLEETILGVEQTKNYEYDDDEENEQIEISGDEGTSTNRRLPLRYGGRWEKTFILPRGIHSQKLGPGRFTGQYTMARHPGEVPLTYSVLHERYTNELSLTNALHREEVRQQRDHRRTKIKIAKKNEHTYRQQLMERRISFFDEDLWDLMTPEEQALERNNKNMKEAQVGHSELRVALRKK